MKNKEAIQILVKYFMKQDKEFISYVLAAMMIDLQRFANFANLEKNEKESLTIRSNLNLEQMQAVLNRSEAPLQIIKMNSDNG